MPSALEYFEEIAKIPRPSGHEEKIREYLKEFAAKHSLECIEDAAGNIIIRRGDPKVTLQGHMDMVPESLAPFDFETCGIKTSGAETRKRVWLHTPRGLLPQAQALMQSNGYKLGCRLGLPGEAEPF